jgi:hypothetical protein
MKTILKLLFFNTILLLFGCSEELFDEQINKSNIKIQRISMDDTKFKENHKLMKSVDNLLKNQSKNAINRFEFNSEYDFFIDEENGIYIEKDNLESYTFPAYKNETDSLVTNIVFNKTTNGDYDVIIAKYNLLKTELNNLTKEELIATDVIFINITNKFSALELICMEEYSYESTNDLVGADSEPFFQWIITGSYCFWSNSTGSGGDDAGGSAENSGGGILTSPIDSNYGGGGGSGSTKTPCQQLKDNNSKPITNTTPQKTVLDNLNDLTTQMSTVPRERMYVLFPTSTSENQYEESFTQGPLNGGDAELNVSGIYISALMHCHYKTSLLSIFSLSDIYQMYSLQSSGFLLNNGETFTSYLVTAHGTKYAIRFTPPDPNSLNTYNQNFFVGWEFNNVKDVKEKAYEQNVNIKNTISQNELGFLKFLRDQNLGVEIYKADATFTQWSKLTIGTDGLVKPIPCI